MNGPNEQKPDEDALVIGTLSVSSERGLLDGARFHYEMDTFKRHLDFKNPAHQELLAKHTAWN